MKLQVEISFLFVTPVTLFRIKINQRCVSFDSFDEVFEFCLVKFSQQKSLVTEFYFFYPMRFLTDDKTTMSYFENEFQITLISLKQF